MRGGFVEAVPSRAFRDGAGMFVIKLSRLKKLGWVLLLRLRLRSVRIGWLKARVDDPRKRNKVMLECRNLRCQSAVNAKDLSCITDGFLGSARSADGRWIQQDVVQRIQVASQLV